MTTSVNELRQLLDHALQAVHLADPLIMKIYEQADLGLKIKADDSPVTTADLQSHHCIVRYLTEHTPDIPILSEEEGLPDWQERQQWARYWLIDPLDGTKEFIKRNGEFTINIALIEHGDPVLGVVSVPALHKVYTGINHAEYQQAKRAIGNNVHVIQTEKSTDIMRIIVSRSHHSVELSRYLTQFAHYKQLEVGSSLKFCLIAEGRADLYPRLGPTCEWDTAAGHAIAAAAGAEVKQQNGQPLRYNQKESIKNPHFIVKIS